MGRALRRLWGDPLGLPSFCLPDIDALSDAFCQRLFPCKRSKCSTLRVHTKLIPASKVRDWSFRRNLRLLRSREEAAKISSWEYVSVSTVRFPNRSLRLVVPRRRRRRAALTFLTIEKPFVSTFAEGDKEEETTCLPCPIDRFLKSCDGPLGKCLVGGRCEPDDKDGGCPCDSKLSPFVQCKAIPANNPCIDKEQPCECDGDGDCIINYLPEVTACGDEFLNGCMVNRYVRSRRFPVFLFVTAIFRIPFAVHKNNETMRRSLTFPFPKQVHR